MECLWTGGEPKESASAIRRIGLVSFLKGFKFYVEAEDPDVLVLTETKV